MKLNADTDNDLPRLNRLNGSLAGEIFYGRWPKTSRARFKMQARQVSPPLRAGFSRLLSGDWLLPSTGNCPLGPLATKSRKRTLNVLILSLNTT
jgi:hypothetical protein